MRELWLAYKYKKQELLKKINIEKCFVEYVKSGQPFEIIDGDNNVCILDYFKDILGSLLHKKTTCMTILGP